MNGWMQHVTIELMVRSMNLLKDECKHPLIFIDEAVLHHFKGGQVGDAIANFFVSCITVVQISFSRLRDAQ
jgi:hypothetical protein